MCIHSGELAQLCMTDGIQCLCIPYTAEQAAKLVNVLEIAADEEGDTHKDHNSIAAGNEDANRLQSTQEDNVGRGDSSNNDDQSAEDRELHVGGAGGINHGTIETENMGAPGRDTGIDFEDTNALLKELSECEKLSVGNETTETAKPKKTLGSNRTTRSRSRALADT